MLKLNENQLSAISKDLSEIPAVFLNSLQEELCAVIEKVGIELDENNLSQFQNALRKHRQNKNSHQIYVKEIKFGNMIPIDIPWLDLEKHRDNIVKLTFSLF